MLHKLLAAYNIILASASPRRKDLFKMLDIAFTTQVSDVAEPITAEDPILQTMQHAKNKAAAIAFKPNKQDLVIAADTIVLLQGQILGKPQDKAQAFDYLSLLSGKQHTVITGICIGFNTALYVDYEQSQVQFAELTAEEIHSYVASGEPMDKAGAYGIQGLGSQFIRSIDGCYFNVMGFPIQKFYSLIKSLQEAGHI